MREKLRSYRCWAGAAALALTATLTCADPLTRPVTPVCSSEEDCGAGLRCVASQCVPACDTAFDCPDPGAECVSGACVPRPAGTCELDEDCTTPPKCHELPGSCASETCEYVKKAEGTACSDNDATTVDDRCTAAGACLGRPLGLGPCMTEADCPPNTYCSQDATCLPQLAVGGDCSGLGAPACASGYCDRGRCCPSGADCCEAPSDCPGSYNAAAACDDTSSSTSCQGTRVDATCTGFVCGSLAVQDDSACGGLEHACSGNFRAVACSNQVAQAPPTCTTTCTSDTQCAAGFACSSGACGARPGTGDACTGTGQGSCNTGLRCDHAVCCEATATNCCTSNADCASGLACNLATSSCYATCNDGDSSRCAQPSSTYCQANACIAKSSAGAACSSGGACSSGHCVEGVCCASACDATCSSCRSASTGLTNGTCAPILRGLPDSAPTPTCASPGIGCGGGSCACTGGSTGSSACKLALGQACAGDTECASAACECADAACSTRKCAASHCGVCEFSSNGASCSAGLGSPTPVNDPEDCFGVQTCVSGQCVRLDGATCSSDTQCASGHCECGDASCSAGTRRCAAVDCPICKFTSSGSTCNGALTAGTSCSDGQLCTTLDACNSSGACVGTAVSCNSPAACQSGPGSCNVGTGACVYALKPANTECRASTGPCDPAEVCNGSATTCPSNTFASVSTQCRASGGICDVAEYCTGTSGPCPGDGFASASTQCRPSGGVCDVAENCTGSSAACPGDGFASASTQCRPSGGVCDVAENCTGSSAACPSNGFVSSTIQCRGSAGVCDVAENCTGATAACPADGFLSSTTVCRTAAFTCDAVETCTGAAADCPADALKPVGAFCGTCTCGERICNSSGSCVNGPECRPSGSICP